MDPLPLTYLTAIPLMLAALAAAKAVERWLFWMASLRDLRFAAATDDRYADPALHIATAAGVRRETVRLAKHLVVIVGIGMSFSVWNDTGTRNIAFALLSLLMLFNSVMDGITGDRIRRLREMVFPKP